MTDERLTWIIWPREGTSVNISIRFGKVTLSSADRNWCIKREGESRG